MSFFRNELKHFFKRKLTVQKKIDDLEKKIRNVDTELDKYDEKYRRVIE